MKSFLKWFILLAGVVILLIACAVGVLFIPSVQRSIAERVLTTEDRSVKIESVSVSLRQVKARRVAIVQPGLELHLAALDLRWSPMAFISDGAIDIQSLQLQDLDVKLSSHAVPVDAEVRRPPAVSDDPDLRFAGLALPEVSLTIGQLRGNGSIEMEDGSKVVWQTSAGGIAPGKTGELTFQGNLTKDGLATTLSASLMIDQHDAGWKGARFNADVEAEIDNLAAPVVVNVRGALERSPGREDISLTVSRPLNAATREELFSLRATLEAQQVLRGRGTLNFDQNAILPFTGAGLIPDHVVRGEYDFSYQIPSKNGQATVSLRGNVSNWGAVGAEFAALPTIDWEARFAGGWDVNSLLVRDLNLALGEGGKPKSIELSLSESFRYNWNTQGAAADAAALKESITVAINDFHLGLVNPLIAPQRLEGRVNGRLSVDVDAGGNRVDVRTIETIQIANLGFTNAEGDAVLSGTRLQLRPTVNTDGSTARVVLGDLELASSAGVLARGQTTVVYNQESKQVDSTGDLHLDINAWLGQPIMSAAAESIPAGAWTALADWTIRHDLEQNRLTPGKLSAQVSESGTRHLELKLLKSFTADLARVDEGPAGVLSGVDGDLLELKISKLPLGLADPWVANYTIAGIVETADLRVGKNAQDWGLKADQPIRIRGLSVADSSGLLLRNVDVSTSPSVSSRGKTVDVDISNLEVSSEGLRMIGANAKVSLVPGDSASIDIEKLNVAIDLPRLFSQPVLVDRNNFLTGTLNLDVSGRPSPGGKVVARVRGKDWRLREPLRAISTIEGEVTADWAADGKVNLQGPVRIEGPGGTSSATLAGWVDPSEGKKTFDLNLTGPRVVGEDLLLLAAAFANPAAEGAPASGPGPAGEPSAEVDFPFWGEWQGRLVARLGAVLHAGVQIRDAETEVNLNHRQLTLPYLTGTIAESRMNGMVDIQYDPAKSTPYAMLGNLSLPDVDVGRYLKESTGKQPVVEGIFNLKTEFFANGTDAADLMQRIRGEVDLSGRDGLMRVLAATGRQQEIGIAGAVSSILGGQVRELRIMNDLIRFLEVIRYEQLTLRAVRTDKLDIDLTELLVRGDELRLQGKGGIRYQEGVDILNQPLRVDTQLEARAAVANLLSEIGLLRRPTEPTDDFIRGPSFVIAGTPGSPDFSSLMQIIERAAMSLVTGRRQSPTQPPPAESDAETQEAAPSQPARPEDAIRGLLDGFLRR